MRLSVTAALGLALLLGGCGSTAGSVARPKTAVQPSTSPAPPASPAATLCAALPAAGTKPALPCLPGDPAAPPPRALVVRDIRVGTGPAAKAGDQLTVDYRGALYPGSEFDYSYGKGQPFAFALGAQQVIFGWDEGLVGMKVGGRRLLVIPPDKGYGPAGQGAIPPNATLRFVVDLRKIG